MRLSRDVWLCLLVCLSCIGCVKKRALISGAGAIEIVKKHAKRDGHDLEKTAFLAVHRSSSCNYCLIGDEEPNLGHRRKLDGRIHWQVGVYPHSGDYTTICDVEAYYIDAKTGEVIIKTSVGKKSTTSKPRPIRGILITRGAVMRMAIQEAKNRGCYSEDVVPVATFHTTPCNGYTTQSPEKYLRRLKNRKYWIVTFVSRDPNKIILGAPFFVIDAKTGETILWGC